MPDKEKVKKKKKTSQTIYKIVISKTFSYPSCVIRESHKMQDLYTKAIEDLNEELSQKKGKVFDIEVESELPYKLKSKNIPETLEVAPLREGITAGEAIRAIVMSLVVEEYGELDHEKNPDLFTFEEDWVDDDGHTQEGDIYLNDEIQNKIDDLSYKFSKSINKLLYG